MTHTYRETAHAGFHISSKQPMTGEKKMENWERGRKRVGWPVRHRSLSGCSVWFFTCRLTVGWTLWYPTIGGGGEGRGNTQQGRGAVTGPASRLPG